MNHFATITSAEEYVQKLHQSITETLIDIEAEIEAGDKRSKRTNALMLARWKLQQASRYLDKGRKELRDLARLERVLCPPAPCGGPAN